MNQPDPAPLNSPAAYPDECFLKTLLRWYLGLIIRPVPTIREIVEREWILGGLFTVAWSTSLWLVVWAGLVEFFGFRGVFADFWPGIGILLILVWPISGAVVSVIAVALHGSASLLGGFGGGSRVFAGLTTILGVGSVPAMVGIAAVTWATVADLPPGDSAGSLIFAVILATAIVWVAILAIILVRDTYGLSPMRSGFAVLLAAPIGTTVASVIAIAVMFALLAFISIVGGGV